MPAISFDTIEHSDVTGLETTHHEYRWFAKQERLFHHVDGQLRKIYRREEAKKLLDSLIHEKTTTKKTTAKAARTTESEAVATDRRRPHLVRGGQVGESQNDIKNPVQTNIFD